MSRIYMVSMSIIDFIVMISPYVVVFLMIAAAVWILVRQFYPNKNRSACHGTDTASCAHTSLCAPGSQCRNCHYYGQIKQTGPKPAPDGSQHDET